MPKYLHSKNKSSTFVLVKARELKQNIKGEMAEWSIAAVLKTVEGHTSGGSNPSLSASYYYLKDSQFDIVGLFIFLGNSSLLGGGSNPPLSAPYYYLKDSQS